MGYILPITQYQYNEYQKRDVEDKQDPYFIERPYKVILEEHFYDLDKDKYSGWKRVTIKRQLDQTPHQKPKTEKFYADLTGKGQHFSESV